MNEYSPINHHLSEQHKVSARRPSFRDLCPTPITSRSERSRSGSLVVHACRLSPCIDLTQHLQTTELSGSCDVPAVNSIRTHVQIFIGNDPVRPTHAQYQSQVASVAGILVCEVQWFAMPNCYTAQSTHCFHLHYHLLHSSMQFNIHIRLKLASSLLTYYMNQFTVCKIYYVINVCS